VVEENCMNELSEIQLMTRAAWLYHVAGLNQEATAGRMNLTRARVNRLLQQARETGLVSITINDRDVGLLPVEEALRTAFGLDFCLATPALGLTGVAGDLAGIALRAVGTAGARYLRDRLAERPDLIVGTGWGRTLAHLGRQMSGASTPRARFISLMGSLTANSAFNPFEVVQALAQATGGEGYFLPVPFIADTPQDRAVLLAQTVVARPLDLARRADVALISVGELTETSLLRQQGMIGADDLVDLRRAGAVGDTNGIFFDALGRPVDHPLNARTIGAGFSDLARTTTVLLSAGTTKTAATEALLRSGIVSGLVIDGDAALALLERVQDPAAQR
jgi:DNA-binding transcriptional regulator LsrR (DeoR family)